MKSAMTVPSQAICLFSLPLSLSLFLSLTHPYSGSLQLVRLYLPTCTPGFVLFHLSISPSFSISYLCFGFGFGDAFLWTDFGWEGWQDTKFAQYPSRTITGLSTDRQPILDPVTFQTHFFLTPLVGNGIVCAQNFEKSSVAGCFGMCRNQTIKGSVGLTKSLKAQPYYHSLSFWACFLLGLALGLLALDVL